MQGTVSKSSTCTQIDSAAQSRGPITVRLPHAPLLGIPTQY
jgi:hypothetical protein